MAAIPMEKNTYFGIEFSILEVGDESSRERLDRCVRMIKCLLWKNFQGMRLI